MAREQLLIQKSILLLVGLGLMAGMFAMPITQGTEKILIGCNCTCDFVQANETVEKDYTNCSCVCIDTEHILITNKDISTTEPTTIIITTTGAETVITTQVEQVTTTAEPTAAQQS